MVRKIAYVMLPILILASFGVLPMSLVMGQAGSGNQNAAVTVTAVPGFVYSGGGGGTSTRVKPPEPLVTSDGVFTQPAVLYSEDEMVALSFPEGTTGFTGEGDPINKTALENGGAYIVEMGDVYTVKMDDPPPPLEDAQIVGVVYDFGPDGATFDPPITLTLTYDEFLIPEGIAEGHLIPAWWDASIKQWIPLEVFIVIPELNIIVAPISHFTPFTILAYQRPAEFAAFAASNLLVTPTEVEIGETVNVVILVTNAGSQSGSYEVVLEVNGLIEASQEVTIAPGDRELVGFNIVKDTAGIYSLEVAGFTGSFTVKEEPASPAVTPPPPTTLPPPSPPVDWTIIGGIIAAAAMLGAAGFIYAFFARRRYRYAAVTYPVEVERPAAIPTVVPSLPQSIISYSAVVGRATDTALAAIARWFRSLVSKAGVIGQSIGTIVAAMAGRVRFLVGKWGVIGQSIGTIVAAMAGRVRFLGSKREAIGQSVATVAASIGGMVSFLISKRKSKNHHDTQNQT